MDMEYTYLDYLHIELGLEKADVEDVPLSGRADDACDAIANKEYVKKQLEKFSDDELSDAVKKICDDPEIAGRHTAISYLIWVAALDIKENW